MSNNAIEISKLGKLYKLYDKPIDKILDVFNLSFLSRNKYQEFWALKDINITVKKGERIGIIGRNGAGKSTLLKSIIGGVTPTEGNVEVNGKIQALMELGTGFHPEFTGRENIGASLSYLGLSPRQIKEIENEIIDFAELEGFIDQPIKTYSAGMYARLAFSVATAIKPDILIIDEVLGAGDSYFASKSVERMKKLTQESGATVLFVSHDMSSVEMLCDRCIWIDRGRVRMDGSTSKVSKAYAQEVRKRTALRLKSKNEKGNNIQQDKTQIILRIVHEEGAPISLNNVEYYSQNKLEYSVSIGQPQDQSYEYNGFILVDNHFSKWGNPSVNEDGDYYRNITMEDNLCSAVVFNLDTIKHLQDVKFRIKHRGNKNSKARMELYDGSNYIKVGDLFSEKNVSDDHWEVSEIKIDGNFFSQSHKKEEVTNTETNNSEISSHLGMDTIQNSQEYEQIELENEIDDGSIKLLKVTFEDKDGNETPIFESFEKMRVKIDYEVEKGPIKAEFVVCIHRLGIIALQSLSGLQMEQQYLNTGDQGQVILEIPSLALGKGNYLVSIGIFPPLNYHSLDTEKEAYVLQDRRYEIEILQPEDILIDLGISRSETRWENKITKKDNNDLL
ncbi:ABC transporter ATP-binding protein [Schinkia azotoformans]|uniref:ABC transporter ATP-binding protein n=1 Tax=Schinkia azotoformans TaxID=1454 RepID=UPI002DB662C8|nr:ABC transporter ATP-binding protein [Schinkia azotoformans]MEC1714812.1 ABC transporter ATP-binding protein [Schinkia azotoformans]MEC1741718.1 ABC transporter ATP-binding protein [Schinkia azotoformans]MEC1766604.1 ABC transporter ATP-binding protein [Schinkia azotoformans]MEC1788019.1 ABC transporter ATP-binding protein [Schinkia azotoformans]MED4375415.1 ABC transporter ATP-binding protein [Schinkia azotoformans]